MDATAGCYRNCKKKFCAFLTLSTPFNCKAIISNIVVALELQSVRPEVVFTFHFANYLHIVNFAGIPRGDFCNLSVNNLSS